MQKNTSVIHGYTWYVVIADSLGLIHDIKPCAVSCRREANTIARQIAQAKTSEARVFVMERMTTARTGKEAL